MSFNSLADAWKYLENFIGRNLKHLKEDRGFYDLERMFYLTKVSSYPQDSYPIFHIAGSKGKGSTAAFLAAALGSSGAVVGLYSSPHVLDYRERIQVFNAPLPDRLFLEEIAAIAQLIQDDPFFSQATFFELMTLLALRIFRLTACDFVVLEVGLGGRLDATNVISPFASLITPIEYEHTHILGSDIRQIASEKAGIIKADKPVFIGRQQEVVKPLLREKAVSLSSSISFLEDELEFSDQKLIYDNREKSSYPQGQMCSFEWSCGRKEQVRLSMLGKAQADNAALALMSLRQTLPEQSNWLDALASVKLLARCQFLEDSKSLYCLDGAHTSHSLANLLDIFLALKAHQSRLLIFATLSDKNYREMIEMLAPHFNEVWIPQLSSQFKKIDQEKLAKHFSSQSMNVKIYKSVDDCFVGIPEQTQVLVTGSFFLVSEFLMSFKHYAPATSAAKSYG